MVEQNSMKRDSSVFKPKMSSLVQSLNSACIIGLSEMKSRNHNQNKPSCQHPTKKHNQIRSCYQTLYFDQSFHD